MSSHFDQALQEALQHHQAGRLAEAEGLYRQILACEPNHVDALHFLGVLATQVNRNDVAADLISRAIAMRPDNPDALSNLSCALRNNRQLDAAITACRQAIALEPGHAEAYSNLGLALHEKGQLDAAIAACRQAVALRANYPEALYNLGNALRENGQLDEAVAAYRSALALKPGYVDAQNNLANALSSSGKLDEAIVASRRAVSLDPSRPEGHFNLALLLLLQGNFAEGWKEYEWRWRTRVFPSPRWRMTAPCWDGTNLAGRTILLHAEQGFGDTIQFIRYVPLIVARGGKAAVGCAPEVRRLLQSIGGVERWVEWGQPLPPHDVHCPLSSVCSIFGTTPESIPGTVPYLKADPSDVERWRRELAGDQTDLKVGLAWAANPAHDNHRLRSMPFADLSPLAGVQGASFYSLQRGKAGKQANRLSMGLHLVDRTDDLADFADTAALIANLDLVISVDTAVVHVAGAIGKPVWVLLPFVPDWRWLLHRKDTPWYPTARLFRQPAIGDWKSVISEVVNALLSTGRVNYQ